MYGKNQSKQYLLPKLIEQLKTKNMIKIHNLDTKRDFVYLYDVIEAFIMSMKLKRGFNCFNIGSGVSLSVEEIIKKLQKIAKTNHKVISENLKRDNEINDVYANISRAKNILNWKPLVKIDDGLKNIAKI